MSLSFLPRPLMPALLVAALLALAACTTPPTGPVLPATSGLVAPGTPQARAIGLTRMGETALHTGDLATAIGLFDEALILDEHNLAAALGLGNALLVQGRPLDAANAFERALAIEADAPDAHYGYARAMMALHRPEVAAAHLERLVELRPGETKAVNALGVAYDLQGRHDQALATYRQGLAADPTAMSLRNNLGLSLALAGSYDEAVDTLRPLAEGPQATRRNRQNLALALSLKGDFAAARRIGRVDLSDGELDGNLDYVATLRGMTDPRLRAATLAPIPTLPMAAGLPAAAVPSATSPQPVPAQPALPQPASARPVPAQPALPQSVPSPPSAPQPLVPRSAAAGAPVPLAEVEPAAGPAGQSWSIELAALGGTDAATLAARWSDLQQRHPLTLGHRPAQVTEGGMLATGPFASEARAARACEILAKAFPACRPVAADAGPRA